MASGVGRVRYDDFVVDCEEKVQLTSSSAECKQGDDGDEFGSVSGNVACGLTSAAVGSPSAPGRVRKRTGSKMGGASDKQRGNGSISINKRLRGNEAAGGSTVGRGCVKSPQKLMDSFVMKR